MHLLEHERRTHLRKATLVGCTNCKSRMTIGCVDVGSQACALRRGLIPQPVPPPQPPLAPPDSREVLAAYLPAACGYQQGSAAETIAVEQLPDTVRQHLEAIRGTTRGTASAKMENSALAGMTGARESRPLKYVQKARDAGKIVPGSKHSAGPSSSSLPQPVRQVHKPGGVTPAPADEANCKSSGKHPPQITVLSPTTPSAVNNGTDSSPQPGPTAAAVRTGVFAKRRRSRSGGGAGAAKSATGLDYFMKLKGIARPRHTKAPAAPLTAPAADMSESSSSLDDQPPTGQVS